MVCYQNNLNPVDTLKPNTSTMQVDNRNLAEEAPATDASQFEAAQTQSVKRLELP